MTCEVVVMNKLGLAVATDSAVTVGRNHKVYHSAQKLFPLSSTEPVAIATYGAVSILDVPWEIVIKTYRSHLGARRFDYLEQYQDDFVKFLESSNPLFPESAQEEAFLYTVRSYFKSVLGSTFEKFGSDTTAWTDDAWQALRAALKEDRTNWRYDVMECTGERFGSRVVQRYKPQLKEVSDFFFDGREPPKDVWSDCLWIVETMYTQAWISKNSDSGIVILGFGDKEPYPRVISLRAGTIACNRLRWYGKGNVAIGPDCSSSVSPFAQRQMIDMFYLGVAPDILDAIADRVRTTLGATLDKAGVSAKTQKALNVDGIVSEFYEEVMNHVHDTFRQPLLEALDALPLQEMAVLAKALVNLTAFRAQLATDEHGTVGGDIDVAVITKAEGFSWVDKKRTLGS